MSLIGLFNIFGTLFFGWLGNKVLKKNSLAYIYLGRSIIITLFVILPPSPVIALIFGALMGLLLVGYSAVNKWCNFNVYGTKIFSNTWRDCFSFSSSWCNLGAWLGGLIFDTYGNYEIAWWISVFLGVIAFLLHIFINEKAFNINPELKSV